MCLEISDSAAFLLARDAVLEQALIIRRTEERLLQLCRTGDVSGTVHTAIGQELPAVAVVGALGDQDLLFSNHRGHAHFLALNDDVEGLVAELLGRMSGTNGGFGGSQHLHAGRFLSNGVTGGLAPVAAGRALAARLAGSAAIVALFIGDGALGEGVVYETLNIASRWSLPLLVVVENNGYAQSTAVAETLAGTVRSRAGAFEISYAHADSWNLPRLFTTAESAVATCRSGRPAVLEIATYRLGAHSKGDDHRDSNEVEMYRQRDVLSHLLSQNIATVADLDRGIIRRIDAAVQAALAVGYSSMPTAAASSSGVNWLPVHDEEELVVDSIHRFLGDSLATDSRVILLGEDIGAPYGGAFHVTRDLSHRFPERVRNTPISEAAIVGAACGLALGGNRPIVEIMFGDFLALAFDQILNHAAKFSTVSGGRVQVPMIVRTPMGGRRGYGPTHSQSLEKHFAGISGLRIVALNSVITPHSLYSAIVATLDGPCIVIENKTLYPQRTAHPVIPGFEWTVSSESIPVVRLAPVNGLAAVTLVSYGQMFDEVTAAVQRAFHDEEIVCEAYCISLISPLSVDALLESVATTQTVICVEEGTAESGFGSEVLAQLMEHGLSLKRVMRLGARGTIPAAGPLEAMTLPGVMSIVDAIKAMHGS